MANILFFVFVLSACAIISTCYCQKTTPNFPAILIFGDSTADTGNNNYAPTIFKANHAPYGVDFPNRVATGRFSNGRLVADFLAAGLGIKQVIPPFLQPSLSNDEIRTGVCFASAGSGFDELTTAASGVIPAWKQLELFKLYLDMLKEIVGEKEAVKIVNNSFILISAGTNDFVYNWYDSSSRRFHFKSIGNYQDFLLQKARDFIQQIYDMGGRKFLVAGLPPTGCLPLQITEKSKNPLDRTCIQELNSDSVTYNRKLQKLLLRIPASLSGSKVAYANIYDFSKYMIDHPQKFGFSETNIGCCGSGYAELGTICDLRLGTKPCSNTSEFFFWDSMHPSEAVYRVVASYLLKSAVPQLY